MDGGRHAAALRELGDEAGAKTLADARGPDTGQLLLLSVAAESFPRLWVKRVPVLLFRGSLLTAAGLSDSLYPQLIHSITLSAPPRRYYSGPTHNPASSPQQPPLSELFNMRINYTGALCGRL